MDAQMHVYEWMLTFIRPVWYSIKNLIDYSIICDLYGFSNSIGLDVNVKIPYIRLKKGKQFC